MKRILIYMMLVAAVLPMSSCRRAAEKARRNIRIEAVESVERRGQGGFEIVLRVMNNTGYKLELESAAFEILYAAKRVGSVTLRESVEVPKRTTQSVATQWQLRISDPLALYIMARKINAGDISQVSISLDVKGRGGPAQVNISRERVPLSEFLSTFGLTLNDIKTYLKE